MGDNRPGACHLYAEHTNSRCALVSRLKAPCLGFFDVARCLHVLHGGAKIFTALDAGAKNSRLAGNMLGGVVALSSPAA